MAAGRRPGRHPPGRRGGRPDRRRRRPVPEVRGRGLRGDDEPASVEGASPTTILVRRVRQGVADYYRLQMLGKCWNGLIQHALDRWNIGTPPYGYAAQRHPHPAGIKAAQHRTRTRLVPDLATGPVVTLIFDWRVNRTRPLRCLPGYDDFGGRGREYREH